jgi:RNase P subunit RPR2
MDILSDKTVTTRKPHICHQCLRRFEPGTKMHSQTNTYDGICTIRTCLTCIELIDYIDPSEPGVWWEGEVREAMDSDGFKGTPEEYLKCLESKKKPKP